MTIQKTGFLKQLSNGCKVYTQKVGTNAVTEVLNKDGMHTASRIMTITINCLAPEHYSLLIRLKQRTLMQDC